MVRLFHLINRGNQVLYIIGRELISCIITCVNFITIMIVYTLNSHLLTLKAHIIKNRTFLSSAEMFEDSLTNNVDPDQTAPDLGPHCLHLYLC